MNAWIQKIFSYFKKNLKNRESLTAAEYQLEQKFLFKTGYYVKRSHMPSLTTQPVKIIAFYLPQFHSIPENDEWWGKEFTEWTNVRPALPLYEHHYQPHIPDELGYYNLLDKQTQKKQIAMAKQYGIHGFCFYFYWFNGHRLLEQPLLNYLEDLTLDLPFCLCWANENWSRRWNGRDKDVLIEQKHSPEDDLAFIQYVSKYLKDERCIKINGKPLLLIYRPSLLPDIKKTVTLWRQWCRDEGLGEIYLCCTHSFEKANPEQFGMDAAVEFPPNRTNSFTHKIKPFHADFAGHVYDSTLYLERSHHYIKPSYTLFRAVFPSWDNTPRLKNKSKSFINTSPLGYQRWLLNALNYTIKHFDPSERLVFVNAWNEWAEGAHLEPDVKYGFAWLEATKMALLRAAFLNKQPHDFLQRSSFPLQTESYPQQTDSYTPRLVRGIQESGKIFGSRGQANLTTGSKDLAIVIHAYYEDVLLEIMDYLKAVHEMPLKLFITTPNKNSAYDLFKSSNLDFHIEETPNRGRDILPFLQVMNQVKKEGYKFIVKIHTKKSLHRKDGALWRHDLYNQLLKKDALVQGMVRFKDHEKLGILSPDGHLLPMRYYLGNNIENLLQLGHRMGLSGDEIVKFKFVSGSMFMARVAALEPLLELGLNIEDFEEELGQLDGTLAHAVERAFALSANSMGLTVEPFNWQPKETKKYRYAVPSRQH